MENTEMTGTSKNIEVRGLEIVSPKYGRFVTMYSPESHHLVVDGRSPWRVKWSDASQTFYVRRDITLSNGRRYTQYLHRLVTHCPTHLQVDHVNHDGLDNRLSNLQIVTNAENSENLRQMSTQRSGVTYNTDTETWVAYLELNGKPLFDIEFLHKRTAERALAQAVRMWSRTFPSLRVA
jgi:hypothetical protein